jgi:hypothetical protein
MAATIVAASALLLAGCCVSEETKKAERHTRWLLAMEHGHVASQDEICILDMKIHGGKVQAECEANLAAAKQKLTQVEATYREVCGKCASAEKCEGEIRHLRKVGEAGKDETACP